MNKVFDAYSGYYDLLYRDKGYAAEAAYVDRLLVRHKLRGRELLEFGSGTGMHGRLLAGLGYRVTGIEFSKEMVACAATIEGFTIQHGDIRTVRMGRIFGAVLSLFHVMSYQVTNKDIQSAFASAAAHLGPGGLFIFDFWYSPAVYFKKPEVRVKRLDGDHVTITRIAEPVSRPNENRVDVRYTIHAQDTATGEYRVVEEVHSMRHFSLPEIDLLAAQARFERIGAESFLTEEPPSERTWGVCVILRRLSNE